MFNILDSMSIYILPIKLSVQVESFVCALSLSQHPVPALSRQLGGSIIWNCSLLRITKCYEVLLHDTAHYCLKLLKIQLLLTVGI